MVWRIAFLFFSLPTLLFAQIPGWQVTLTPIPQELRADGEEPEFAPGSLLRVNVASRNICLLPEKTQVRIRAAAGTDWRDVTNTGERDFYPCPSNLSVVLPRELPLGPALLELRVDGNELLAPLTVVASRFGILSSEMGLLTRPFTGGSIVRVTGTGLGVAAREEIHAELDGQPLEFVEARYHAGRDELAFRLPASITADGCYAPVALRIAGRWTMTVPVAVSRSGGGACAHPLKLTEPQMAAIDAGRSAALARLTFSASPRGGLFLAEFFFAGEEALRQTAFSPHEEGCRVEPPRPERLFPVSLDAGVVALRMPDGETVPAPYFGPLPRGEYVMEGSGGRDVLPFRVEMKLPSPPVFARGGQRLPGGEVLIEWDPAGYVEGDMVVVSLSSGSSPYSCKARARNGSMRMPGALFPFPSTLVNVAIDRRKDTPLLFPFVLRNGASFWGVLDYSVSSYQTLRIASGGGQ
ncbi:MAG: hypothetical protein JST93_13435 [Acidobacteria bacterium]|nr:hypothetical protein [Acidobacteriota bacterium]